MADKVDDAYQRIVDYFNGQITELSNSECEHLLTELIAKFDGLLEGVKEAAIHEQVDDKR